MDLSSPHFQCNILLYKNIVWKTFLDGFQCAYDIQNNKRSPWGRKNMAFNRCWLHQNQENEETPSCDEISICSCIKSKRKLNEIVRRFFEGQ